MSKPLLLDLFAGIGGAAKGYMQAGFDVIGVDLQPTLDYPGSMLVVMDALEALEQFKGRVDAVHASPPCQASCALTKGTNQGREYEQMIPATRAALDATGLPYVIENVQGSDLRRDLTLCGEMFGLGVLRHRYFEVSGFEAVAPAHKPHRGRVRGWRHGTYYDGPYVAVYGDGGGKGSVAEWQVAMGIDWTNDRKALAESIPSCIHGTHRPAAHGPARAGGRMTTTDPHPDACPTCDTVTEPLRITTLSPGQTREEYECPVCRETWAREWSE